MHRRMFEGTLEELLLEELEKQPGNGLALIEALTERFRGWLPIGPDSVYPALQLLEDRGQIVPQLEGDRRVYTVTDLGRTRLAEARKRRAQGDEAGDCGHWHPHHGLGRWVHHLDPAKMSRIKEVVHKALLDIKGIAVG